MSLTYLGGVLISVFIEHTRESVDSLCRDGSVVGSVLDFEV